MNKIFVSIIFLFLLFLRPIFAMESSGKEAIEELSVYVTSGSEQSLYIRYYIGSSWTSSTSKGSQMVSAGAVNLLAKEGIDCSAEAGSEGISKDQKNIITVQVYDNSSPERKLLGTQTTKVYLYNAKKITRDKGNYLHVVVSKDYKITLSHVEMLTEERKLEYKEYGQLPILIGVISFLMFMFLGTMLIKKFSLGLLFLTIHSFIVLIFSSIDTMDAITAGSSGFALIPIVMIDFPVFFFAKILSGFIAQFIPIPLNNTTSIIIQNTILHKVAFTVPMLVFGGLQWYCIGWLTSKGLTKLKTQAKQSK